MTENRFRQPTIATLAKRAANQCSNPDCGAITCGPSDDPRDSVNVGEAAHIFGANPGSARFSADMSPAQRCAISNAIWLCSTCHKLVDDDPLKYPAGLLFEWQREHEHSIARQVGKAGAATRQRYEKRHLEEFGSLSYLAERLILEKDAYWEYRLTAEILRFEMSPILRRWNALRKRLYFKPSISIGRSDFLPWIMTKNREIESIFHAFDELVNVEFQQAWGVPGTAGNDVDIIATCRLFAEMCQSALTWEESLRFVTADDIFLEILKLYAGTAGSIIDEAAKLPEFLSQTLTGTPAKGVHELSLKLVLPEGWSELVVDAMSRLSEAMINSQS